jgi:UDP-N-acetylmuramyl pentapeptide synthase
MQSMSPDDKKSGELMIFGMKKTDCAKHFRSLNQKTRFVAITGSCGKTTTKDLATYLLQPELQGLTSADYINCGIELADNILNVKPDDDYCIQELGAWGAGTLDAGIELVQPDIGVVLNVRNDHYSKFKGRKNTQAEKAKIVESLPPTGTAILNCDDSLVWEMRNATVANIIGFGSQPYADLRVEQVSSEYPERLSFKVTFEGNSYDVKTQLFGTHLVGSALAALCIAVAMGVPIKTAIGRLAEVAPTHRRMSSVSLENGVTFIRDDFKATFDSMPEVVSFLNKAHALRKVAVLGRISDYSGRSRPVFTEFATRLSEVVDILILVGERHEDLWGRKHRDSELFLAEFDLSRADVHLFETVYEASCFLREELRKDDLVFLKGSGVSDHLERVLLQFQTNVKCWKSGCGRVIACDECDLLETASL